MTTLALKTAVANKIIASADAALGSVDLKSGRYWYKGQQNCDLLIFRQGRETIIHASGGVRFRIAITADGKEAHGSLSLLGWLRETPNAIRIVTTLLASHSQEILRRRELLQAVRSEALANNRELPLMTEAMGSHFSVKADEEKLEEKDRITQEESDRNFATAIKSRWYHQSFVNFCKAHRIKCYYRSVFSEVSAATEALMKEPSEQAVTVAVTSG